MVEYHRESKRSPKMRCPSSFLIFPALIVICLILSCGSDSRNCTEPEPDHLIMGYAFKGLVPVCEACGQVYPVHWYFECEPGVCQYLGYWDPLQQQDPPAWFSAVAEAQQCYDGCTWGCAAGSLWAPSLDPSKTPRENEEAEQASIWLSGSLVAPQELYDRIANDLAMIRSTYSDAIPELDRIRFLPCLQTSSIWLDLMPDADLRVQQGQFHDLDSLNALFKVCQIKTYNTSTCGPSYAYVFDGRYNTIQLSQIYKDAASVLWAEPGYDAPSMGFEVATVLPWPLE